MQQDDTYKTIKQASEGLYKDKGSKFISLAWPVTNEEQIKELLAGVKKQYYDARHHCYAWVLDQDRQRYRVNDDGEPSGTAGKPIHGQILSNELTNILIVVVRYFGGTKLGVRGLINAYKGAAQDALQNAEIVTLIIHDFFEINFSYQAMNDVMKIIKDYNIIQVEHHFDLSCRIVMQIRQNMSVDIQQTFEKVPQVKLNYLYSA